MNIYVIDSCRVAAWKTMAASGLQISLVHEVKEFPPLHQEDVVFGHAHLDSSGDAPDLALVDWLEDYPFSNAIRAFLAHLKSAQPPPRICLYSGDPLDPADHEEFTAIATSRDGPLHGICQSRIKWLTVPVDRQIQADDFRALISGEIDGFSCGLSATSLELVSALSLLCECHLIHRGKLQLPSCAAKRGRSGSCLTIDLATEANPPGSPKATLQLHAHPSGWKSVLGSPKELPGTLAELKKSGMQATLMLVDAIGKFDSGKFSKTQESLIELAHQEMAEQAGTSLL
jgi:hypothetical protein